MMPQATNNAGPMDEALVERVARAIARATIEAAEPDKFGRLSAAGIEAMIENLAVKFYPEARAAITAIVTMPQPQPPMDGLAEAAIATGSALDDWIKIIGGPHGKPRWLRPPSHEEVQEAMRANDALADLLATPSQQPPASDEMLDAVVEAIEPFERIQRGFFDPGNCGPDMPRCWPDKVQLFVRTESESRPQFCEFGLTVGDFRKLAAVLAALKEQRDGR